MLGRTEKTMLSASCRYMIDKITMGRVHTSNKHGNAPTLFRGDHNRQAALRLLYPPTRIFHIHTYDRGRKSEAGALTLALLPCFHCTEAEYVTSGHCCRPAAGALTLCDRDTFARIRCRIPQLRVLTPGQPRSSSTGLNLCKRAS